jgi:hypothetical protein
MTVQEQSKPTIGFIDMSTVSPSASRRLYQMEDHLYEDTHKLAEELSYLTQQGVSEASAPPGA